MTCLFVGNLTKSVSEPKLNNTFSAIGKCKVELKVCLRNYHLIYNDAYLGSLCFYRV